MSAEFLLTSLIVCLVPGTGVVYTVAAGIGGGRRAGLLAALGGTLGVVPHILAAMAGLSGVMQAGSVAFEVIRWVGVAYLIYMGIGLIRGGGLEFDESDEKAAETPALTVIRRAVLLNLLNPKLTLFFFAFLPQFISGPPSLLDPQLLLLCAVFMAMTFAVFAIYALASAAARDLILGAPRVRAWIERSLGALLVAFAAQLAASK